MSSNSARLFQEGLAAAHAGETDRALEIARTLLARNARDVHAFQIIGFAEYCRGRNNEALEAFAEANRLAPNQPAILNWIGVIQKERGDFKMARAAFERAVRRAPQDPEIVSNLGESCALLGEKAAAQRAYETAAAIEPPNPAVIARTARFFERNHDIDRARHYAERALALDPANETAHIAMAEIEIREQDYEAVIARLSAMASPDSANVRNHAKMHHLLAEAYDRTGRYEQAFQAYATANNMQKGFYASLVADEPSPLKPPTIARLISFFAAEDVSAWTRHDKFPGNAPVFLVGFSRSGTTWLDQILSSHPEIVVLEEEDNLFDAWNDFLLDTVGMRKLKALSADEIKHYRQAYWRRVDTRLKDRETGKLFVDKVPLNTMQLGLIYRLFPESKIIFAIRDPRDAVFSCFQQHFAINAAMYQFLTLESAAAYYDQFMTLGEIYREKFPLMVHDVRYENLVEDLEAEIRPLISFLGLEWSDSVLSYDQTARNRTILTPSLRQVVNRPYATSIGKWRRYAEQMRPVLPILEKWAAKFGYDVNKT